MDDRKTKQQVSGPVWHRVGWASRTKDVEGRAVDEMDNRRQQRHYAGPVSVRLHTHVFAHSRVMQHMHRTTLARSWVPGLYGLPAAEPNSGFYSELDVRLRNMHESIAAVSSRSRAVRRQREHEVETGGAHTADGMDLLRMRQQVNQSLDTQLDFFTRCMASYGLAGTTVCTCPGCDCTCRRTQHMLRGLALGEPVQTLA